MKILFTGMTSAQVGTSIKQYMTVVHPTAKMLEDMGHEVERREIVVDENLDHYDKIVCMLFPIEKLSATRKYSVFDAIYRYPEKIIIMFDDWQYYQFQDSLRVCLNGNRFWNFVDIVGFASKKDIDTIKAHPEFRSRIEKAALSMVHDLKFPLLFPKLWWGKRNQIRVKTTGMILTYDIMDYALQLGSDLYDTEPFPGKREKSWVMASLFNNLEYVDKLKLTWPVIHIGHKSNVPFIPEHELFEMYKRSWGILSHPYARLGNDGWWRARWMHAVLSGCVISAADIEAEGLPMDFFFSIEEIEKASESQLKEMAESQKFAIMMNSPGNFEAAECLDILIKGV